LSEIKNIKSGTSPFSALEWFIAGRYLRARRKDTFISVIAGLTLTGIAIGVATLIVVTSVMNGFREDLLSKILGLNGHFIAYPVDSSFSDYDETAIKLEQIDGVVHAFAFVEGQALVSSKSQSTGISVRGVTKQSIEKLPMLLNSVELGSWENWDQSEGAAIGYRLAQKLGVTLGDKITLINPDGATTPFGTTPQIRSYPIVATFDLGMVEFDSFFVYLPMRTAQKYFKLHKDVLRDGATVPDFDASDEEIDAAYEQKFFATAVELFIDDPDNVDEVRERIYAQVERPLILTDWQQRNQTFFEALQVERVVMFVILSMIVVVAAFNIISSLVMLVKDKGRDIAVLRTMGITRAAIMRIFIIVGTTIGFLGTLLGLMLGLVLAMNAESIRLWLAQTLGVSIFPPEVFFLSQLPSRVDIFEVSIILAMALGLSFLATLYPAWRAAQYEPVEALRYE